MSLWVSEPESRIPLGFSCLSLGSSQWLTVHWKCKPHKSIPLLSCFQSECFITTTERKPEHPGTPAGLVSQGSCHLLYLLKPSSIRSPLLIAMLLTQSVSVLLCLLRCAIPTLGGRRTQLLSTWTLELYSLALLPLESRHLNQSLSFSFRIG